MGLMFNGSNYCRTLNTFSAPAIGTVTGWIYPTNLGGDQRILGSSDTFELRCNGTTITHEFCFSGTGLQSGISNNVIYNFVCRYNRSTRAGDFYLNGNLVASRADGYDDVPPVAELSIANITGRTNYFRGIIEDVRIYDRWISDNEIESIYHLKGVDDIFDGLIHRWILNNGDENTIASEAGSVKDIMGGLHCTPYNNPTYILSPNKYKRALA